MSETPEALVNDLRAAAADFCCDIGIDPERHAPSLVEWAAADLIADMTARLDAMDAGWRQKAGRAR